MSSTPRKALNPWPASIIALFVVAICGAVSMVIFCTRQPVELVAADYYEQELHFQDRLDRTRHANALPAPAQIAYDHASRRVTITLPAGQSGNSKGSIQLYRPSSTVLDRTLPLQVDAHGVQVIDATTLSDGLWHVRVSWTANGTEYFCDEKVVVGRRAT